MPPLPLAVQQQQQQKRQLRHDFPLQLPLFCRDDMSVALGVYDDDASVNLINDDDIVTSSSHPQYRMLEYLFSPEMNGFVFPFSVALYGARRYVERSSRTHFTECDAFPG